MSEVNTWSTTAADNDSAPPDGFPEGMNPSGVNDACREVMAAIATWRTALDVTQIELGHASDTTIARSAAGEASIEGNKLLHALDIQTKVKTADEIVTNSATLQDDDHLVGFSLEANTRYLVEIDAVVLAGATGSGFRYAATTSETPQDSYGMKQYISDNASSDQTVSVSASFASSSNSITVSGQGFFTFRLVGQVLTHATNASTIKFRWAQQTATNTTTMYSGSMMRVTKIN